MARTGRIYKKCEWVTYLQLTAVISHPLALFSRLTNHHMQLFIPLYKDYHWYLGVLNMKERVFKIRDSRRQPSPRALYATWTSILVCYFAIP
jgi:hypothetical protein